MALVPNTRKRLSPILLFFAALSLAIFVYPLSGNATIAHARKTGKPCKFCHVKIGGGGPLTPSGEKFRNAGYTLTEPARPSHSARLLILIGAFLTVGGFVAFLFWVKKRKRTR